MEDHGQKQGDLEDFPGLDDLDLKLDEDPLNLDSIDLGDSSAADDFDLALEPSDGEDLSLALEDDLSGGDFGDLELSSDSAAFEDSSADDAGSEPSSFESALLDSSEDESVSLTEAELENILGASSDDLFDDMPADSGALPVEDYSDSDETPESRASADYDSIPEVDLDPIAPPVASGELGPDEDLGFDDFSSASADELVIPELEDDGAASPEPAGLGVFDEDDEPIALSADELDNIMSDVAPADADADGMADFDSAYETAGDESAGGQDETPSFASLDEEDENITLTDDELSKVLLDADMESHDVADADDDLPAAPSLSSLDMDDDEPIALTAEELGNIVSEVEVEDDASLSDVAFADFGDEASQLDAPGFGDESDLDFDSGAGAADELNLDEMEEGPTALSDSELDSILADTSGDLQERSGLSDEDPYDHPQDVIVLDEYEESDARERESAGAALESSRASMAERVADDGGVNRDELKKMISYLDRLFDQLPENAVREFSHSEYFDLYKKIMDELGI